MNMSYPNSNNKRDLLVNATQLPIEQFRPAMLPVPMSLQLTNQQYTTGTSENVGQLGTSQMTRKLSIFSFHIVVSLYCNSLCYFKLCNQVNVTCNLTKMQGDRYVYCTYIEEAKMI